MEESKINGLEERRSELDFLFKKARYAQIGRMEGIRIVKKRQELPNQDCFSYALGIPWGRALVDKVREINALPEVQDRKEGDYVLYLSKNGDSNHIGVLQENGKVISKWDKSHVYEHPIMLVPFFGDKVRVVRDPKKNGDQIGDGPRSHYCSSLK